MAASADAQLRRARLPATPRTGRRGRPCPGRTDQAGPGGRAVGHPGPLDPHRAYDRTRRPPRPQRPRRVWFRLLRSVLDEVSPHPGRQKAATRDMLQLIWRATGMPERGGLRSWVPYENMDTSMQENIMRAAAAALHLAATGQITPRGIHGPALRAAPHLPATKVNVPSRTSGKNCSPCSKVWSRRPGSTGPPPGPLRAVPRRPPRSRVPAEHLPTAAELGLDDLT
jgi:hypothetical protein